MRLRVSERERAAPRPAKHEPLIDTELFANRFDVLDQAPGRVVFERSVRTAVPGAALIEENDAIRVWIEEAAIVGNETRAWTTVQKDDRLAVRRAALFV